MSTSFSLVAGFLAGALLAWFAMHFRAQVRHHALRAGLESERATLSERPNGARAEVVANCDHLARLNLSPRSITTGTTKW